MSEPTFTDLPLRFQTFAVLVLQRRARNRRETVAEIIEGLLWEDCYVDEMQAVAQESVEAGEAFTAWFQHAVMRRK
jgi:predicted nucleic-acid-binding protein